MRNLLVVVLGVFFVVAGAGESQAQTVVTGTVVDSSSGEPVPRATVRAAGTYAGTAADEEGRFALRVPPKVERLRIGAVGYATAVRRVPAGRDSVTMTVRLRSRSVPLGHVTVEANRTTGTSRPSSYTIRAASVTQAPSLGEPDIIRAAARLPGIAQPNDLDARLNVRGGSADQNQYLLDGIEIYNPTHLFGLYGAFNPYVTGNTTVHAASFPARHGGRLSSVINVQTRVPPDSGYTRANLSLTSLSGAHAQKWGDTGVVVGVRRTYLDPVLRAIGTQTRYNFLDANLKVRHEVTDQVSVTGLGYFQRDDLSSTNRGDTFDAAEAGPQRNPGKQFSRWGNVLGALRLEAHHGALQHELTGSFVRPHTEVNLPTVALTTRLHGWTVRYDGSRTWDRTHLQFGGHWKRRTFDYEWSGDGRSLANVLYGGVVGRGNEPSVVNPASALRRQESRSLLAGHATVERRLFEDRLTLRGGLRVSGVQGEAVAWQPRFRVTVEAGSALRVHASAGRYAQHVATGAEGQEFNVTEPLLPLDRPTTAWTYTAGLTADLGERYQVQTTAYARTMDHFPRLERAGQSPSETGALPFRYGTATAYGLDLLLKKSKGWVTGQLAYSFGHVRTAFGDERYPPSWSIPHSLRTTLGVHLGKWDLQTSANVHSGLPYTPPVARTLGVSGYPSELTTRYLLGDRNSERLPTYARVDLALRRTYRTDWGRWELYLQVLNLLNRRNLLRIPSYSLGSLYRGDRSAELGERSLPILPSIGIEFTL